MTRQSGSVQILLGTFNGEKHLREQLDSILNQDIENFELVVNDDGSSDKTSAILQEYAVKYDNIVVTNTKMGGAKENFSYLLEKSTADYMFLSDQDDIWPPDKMSKLMQLMILSENRHGKECPLLVHSDLRLIDARGNLINSSMWKHQNLNPRWGNSFPRMLTQNVVTGCSTMLNRSLVSAATPIPKFAIMHDWWLALVASAFGFIVYTDEVTTFYRQHATNEIGAKKFDYRYILSKVLEGKTIYRENRRRLAMQATEFSNRFPDTQSSRISKKFSRLPIYPLPKRIVIILWYRFYKIGLVRNVAWVIL